MVLIRPVFLARLLKVANWNLIILADGIKIDHRLMPWNKILKCKIDRGYFWSTVEFNNDRDSALKGVGNLGAWRLQALSKSAKYVLEATRRIDEAIESPYYFSEYDRHLLMHKLRELVDWTETDDIVASLELIPKLFNQHARVQDYIRGNCQEIETRNSSFVNGELARWAEWIKEIRLTEEQARSVIIMEDRNLLVAAAGSGKTSTILAKAAYAIAAGYCKPNEILILSFNKDVRDQIVLRLKRQLPATSHPTAISVETFHSFGHKQIKLLGKPTRVATWASDVKSETAHICRLMESLSTKNRDFALDLALFCSVWSKIEESEKEEIKIASGKESFEEAFRLQLDRKLPEGTVPTHETLAHGPVRSLQELKICNWLILMGVAFKYEEPFKECQLPSNWTSGYRPDFFYPQIGCWHEHFGINKFGKAPQFSASNRNPARKTYEVEVEEKRNFLNKSGADWFETTSADFESEEWWEKIERELKNRGLKPEFIGWEQFQELSQSTGASTGEIASLIVPCLHHAKSNRLARDDIVKILSESQSTRANAFLRVFLPVYDAYQTSLREDDSIDFEDMISLTTDAFQSGQLQHKYRLILVDEFQDVSNSRAELISSMLAQSPDVRAFCSG